MKNEILLINERIESNDHFLNNFGSFFDRFVRSEKSKRHA